MALFSASVKSRLSAVDRPNSRSAVLFEIHDSVVWSMLE